MKFSVKDFFSKCDQIRNSLQIWSHLLKKSLMENFIFYAVSKVTEPAHNYTRSQAHFQVFSCRSLEIFQSSYPANIYLFKVNNRNTRKRYEISSKLIIKAPERRHWLYCQLWTFFTPFSSVSIVEFEQINIAGYSLEQLPTTSLLLSLLLCY